jgi:hypothetical protein
MVVTFLFSSLQTTCNLLDIKRLNKQKIEAKEILDATLRTSGGWINHPAVHMWRGYSNALKYYFNCIVEACIRRGLNNTMELYEFTQDQLNNIEYQTIEDYLENGVPNDNQSDDKIIMPWWFKWRPLLYSHRCSLLRKNPKYYTKIFSTDCMPDYVDKGYIWPMKLTREQILDFKPEYCEPIGTGAPANYRWTREQVLEWLDNPQYNPKTGRSINLNSKVGIHSDLKKAAKIYGLLIKENVKIDFEENELKEIEEVKEIEEIQIDFEENELKEIEEIQIDFEENELKEEFQEFIYEKDNNNVVINYTDIDSFIKSKKIDNDKNNKLRENIIGSIINNKVPDYYYENSIKWKNMRDEIHEYILKLAENNEIISIENVSCSHKGGRGNHYDFIIILNKINKFKVELKFNCSNISDAPQFVSPMKPSQYLSNSYEDYYYDNYLTKLSELYNLEIPDKITYLKEIHSNEPKCMMAYKEKYKNEEKFYIDANKFSKESIYNFIQMSELNIKKLSEYLLLSQSDKFYMMYTDDEKFKFQKINPNNYKIVNYIKNPKLSRYEAITETGIKLKILLRWKNGNGIAFPAFQIS